MVGLARNDSVNTAEPLDSCPDCAADNKKVLEPASRGAMTSIVSISVIGM
jgi:hypothetical protein